MSFILSVNMTQAWLSAQQNDTCLCLCGYKSKQEHIFASAQIALQRRILEWTIGMHLHLLMVGFYHMPEYMASIVVLPLSITEPLVAVL